MSNFYFLDRWPNLKKLGIQAEKYRVTDPNASMLKTRILEEQERIVFILERAESAIQKREESNRLLDEYLKSVFVEIFGDPVTNPKGWDKKKLKDFGKVVTGNTPSRKQEEYYGDYIE